jgi:formylglycine-generating enzyme required for sulfatase activity
MPFLPETEEGFRGAVRPNWRLVLLAAGAVLAIGALALFIVRTRRITPRITIPDHPRGPPGMAFIEGGRIDLSPAYYRWLHLYAREQPTTVNVPDYCMDRTLVSAAQYWACVNAGACTTQREDYEKCVRTEGCEPRAADEYAPCNYENPTRRDYPSGCATMANVKRYCAWAGKRPVREEEWVWAARGGTRAFKYPWGDDPPRDQYCAEMDACTTTDYKDGALGLFDMAGNQNELTQPYCGDDRDCRAYRSASASARMWVEGTRVVHIKGHDRLFGPGSDVPIPWVSFRCAADPLPQPQSTPSFP